MSSLQTTRSMVAASSFRGFQQKTTASLATRFRDPDDRKYKDALTPDPIAFTIS